MNIVFASLLSIVSIAQVDTTTSDEESQVVYPAVQIIDIDSLDIEATAQKPEIKIIHERNRIQFGFLSQLRSNFDNEIAQTINDIK